MLDMRTMLAVLTLTLVSAAGLPGRAQQPRTAARLDAYVKALSSGSPEQFEAMAKENFTPELLARTADQRGPMVARIHSDFGELTVATEDSSGPTHVDLVMKSNKNAMPMTIGMDFEAAAPFRIAGVSIRVGGPAAGGSGRGGRGGPPPLPMAPINGRMSAAEMSDALGSYLAGLATAGDFAGVVLVAKDGKSMFERAYGVADHDRNTPMTTDLRFNLASIGKAFTKTAIGQLIAAGKLKESDTIATLLPDYPNPAARTTTIDQLLHFQVGIADFFGGAFDQAPKQRFQSNHDYYRFVAPQPLTFAPGERTEYCNGCYIVLGEIIEKVAGMPYERYIQDHVFAPAGIRAPDSSAMATRGSPPATRASRRPRSGRRRWPCTAAAAVARAAPSRRPRICSRSTTRCARPCSSTPRRRRGTSTIRAARRSRARWMPSASPAAPRAPTRRSSPTARGRSSRSATSIRRTRGAWAGR